MVFYDAEHGALIYAYTIVGHGIEFGGKVSCARRAE